MAKRISAVQGRKVVKNGRVSKPVATTPRAKSGRIMKKKAAPAKPKFEKRKPASKEDLDKELEEYMRKSNHPRIDASDL
ncbi:hypothetical protein L596_010677 [Steinernema carpocapsae]|uniref:Chromatin target of PRMT1 protein C-terminal domain-containing protein n=1 Tax=Steinernema carpocapsae TaxID=34508 RepID=A0A4U5PKR0_STECR|nr:hypothetical protein L596_010677 [Steinernema carpocapsae]